MPTVSGTTVQPVQQHQTQGTSTGTTGTSTGTGTGTSTSTEHEHGDAGKILEQHEQEWQHQDQNMASTASLYGTQFSSGAGTGQASGLSVEGEEGASSNTGGSTGA